MPTKSICLCGTIEGGPHDRICPYPYYGNDPKLESQWMDAWRMKRNDQESTQPLQTDEIRKLTKLFGG